MTSAWKHLEDIIPVTHPFCDRTTQSGLNRALGMLLTLRKEEEGGEKKALFFKLELLEETSFGLFFFFVGHTDQASRVCQVCALQRPHYHHHHHHHPCPPGNVQNYARICACHKEFGSIQSQADSQPTGLNQTVTESVVAVGAGSGTTRKSCVMRVWAWPGAGSVPVGALEGALRVQMGNVSQEDMLRGAWVRP